jgi:coiled-coil domain-containing protein 130
VPDDKTVGRKLADDAMYKLEHEKDDKGKSQDARPRIEHISFIQDRVKDDYLANRMLRYIYFSIILSLLINNSVLSGSEYR